MSGQARTYTQTFTSSQHRCRYNRQIMDPCDTLLERFFAALPGWLFVIAGLSLLAMAMLTPTWLSLSEVRWQHNVMGLQARQLDTQKHRYVQFDQALKANNPTVLTRLALIQLHEQPADMQVLIPPALPAGGRLAMDGAHANESPLASDATEAQSASVGRWLAASMPRVRVNVPAYSEPDTRLIRLCSGASRWVVLAAGAFCVLGGVWWRGTV